MGLRSSREAGVLLCAGDEQCQCCGGELIQRPGQCFLLQAEARKTEAHICSVCCELHQWIPWGVEIQTRAQWTFLEHSCQATIAYGGLTRRDDWMVQPAASSEEWCSVSALDGHKKAQMDLCHSRDKTSCWVDPTGACQIPVKLLIWTSNYNSVQFWFGLDRDFDQQFHSYSRKKEERVFKVISGFTLVEIRSCSEFLWAVLKAV